MSLGYIHSLQSMGAVDGPGIRFCVFLQGCPLRCMYCHNPDTWLVNEKNGGRRLGTPYTVEELVKKILRYKPYFANGGGVTVTGGEPLMQAEFVEELFTHLHKYGIHTCLDTSGNYPDSIFPAYASTGTVPLDTEPGASTGTVFCDTLSRVSQKIVPADAPSPVPNVPADAPSLDALLSATDLVICDIKFTTEKDYHTYTGGSLNKVLSFLDKVTQHGVPLWVRHVVVPGYTDSAEEVKAMAEIARKYPTLEKIELLPFHKLCIPKYEALGIPFRCADIPECDTETITKLIPLTYYK